jgi:hypothetical protein
MSSTLLLSQARSFPGGRAILVASVKRTFWFGGSTSGPGAGASALREGSAAPFEDAFDFAVNRGTTDVVLSGHVVLNGAASALAEIAVGDRARRVRAFAPRTVRAVANGVVDWVSSGAVARVPLREAEAYGGSWTEGSEEVGYPRNLGGRGFVTPERASALVGTAMPSLEDPESPVEPHTLIREDLDDWVDAPFPALFGWRELESFPRSRFFGARVPFRPWQRLPRECELGVLTAEEFRGARLRDQYDLELGSGVTVVLEPRAFSAGALGLSGALLQGGEPVVLRGLFADAREHGFVVPRARSVVGLRPPGCPQFDLPTTLVALLLDADAKTVSTVEQATLEVAAPYPDDEVELVGLSHLGETGAP